MIKKKMEGVLIMQNQLVNMTWEEAEKINRNETVLLIPVGAIEQHGPHLPLDTDTIIAENLSRKLAETQKKYSLVMAPSIRYTYAKPSTVLPGTLSINGDTFIQYFRDIVQDFIRQGFTKIGIINAHMENTDFILEGIDQALKGRGDITVAQILWWEFCTDELLKDISGGIYQNAKDDHASVIETALVLACAPETVKTDRMARADDQAPSEYGFRILPWNRSRWPKTGVFSIASKSTSEMGDRLMKHLLKEINQFIENEF